MLPLTDVQIKIKVLAQLETLRNITRQEGAHWKQPHGLIYAHLHEFQLGGIFQSDQPPAIQHFLQLQQNLVLKPTFAQFFLKNHLLKL